jgi:hypothetical protein
MVRHMGTAPFALGGRSNRQTAPADDIIPPGTCGDRKVDAEAAERPIAER